ncbi:MAG TPA: hypothetical protein VJY99_11130 [Buttiauxella sp.]|uniref:hypothetical protein n=1 Tax=Buttiauxella sp. TaxID=1972222 RepID=UPI002B4908AA|nr:hypothetical protein [Buttiauxella sp.]HKM97231.1 hypothetical protein [Buttiauxella sp.]
MKESIHVINGKAYTFSTKENKTYLTFKSTSRPAIENHVEICIIPSCKIITRSNGDILFALALKKGTDEKFEILTAQQLYDNTAWQWFEPLADNYHELIYLNDNPETYSAYKHFSWQDIVDFAEVDRPAYQYRAKSEGDWKAHPQGGAKYLMVMIDNYPYWTDAIGQVPFAIDTYRLYHSIPDTVSTGITWGSGKYYDAADKSNSYDNYFVLRAALYASKRFFYERIDYVPVVISESGKSIPIVEYKEATREVHASELRKPITEMEVQSYAAWKK